MTGETYMPLPPPAPQPGETPGSYCPGCGRPSRLTEACVCKRKQDTTAGAVVRNGGDS